METTGKYKFLLKVVVIAENMLLLNGTYLILLSFFPVIDIELQSYQILLLFINLGYLLSLNIFKLAMEPRKWKWSNIVQREFYRVSLGMLVTIVFLFTIKASDQVSRLFVMTYFPLLFLLIINFHLLTREVLYLLFKTAHNRDNAVILGAGSLGKKLYQELAGDPALNINALGFFDDNPSANGGKLLGCTADVKEYVLENNVTKIYCTLPSSAKEKIKDILNFSDQHVVNFHIIPSLRHYTDTPVILETIGNTPVLSIRKIPLSYVQNAFVKRCVDIMISSIFLLTLFPLFYIVIGAGIKLSSPGPIFFTQQRTGKRGKNFKCYKFRSMRVNSESDSKQATANDERKTRFGNFLRRTNLDELLQFVNVWRGDMSIVGPRPHMLLHTTEYSDSVHKYMVRHFIKPGITGLAQVNGYRGETKEVKKMQERIRRDIWYIENWALWLDLVIMWKTVCLVFKGDKNAY